MIRKGRRREHSSLRHYAKTFSPEEHQASNVGPQQVYIDRLRRCVIKVTAEDVISKAKAKAGSEECEMT